MKFIGYKLYNSRKELGLTQSELADKIGCYAADISDWERGKVKPRKSTVKKLASVLNKAMDYFTTRASLFVGLGTSSLLLSLSPLKKKGVKNSLRNF